MTEMHRIILGGAGAHAINHLLFLDALNEYGLKSGKDIAIEYPKLNGCFLCANMTLIDKKAKTRMEKFLSSEIFSTSEDGLMKIVQPQIQPKEIGGEHE